MKSQQQIAPASAVWAIGGVGAVLVLAAFFTANLYATLGFAAIALALAGYLASTQHNSGSVLM